MGDGGLRAHDFTARNQFGETVTLTDLVSNGAALVVFYPFAFSRICTSELAAIQETLPRLAAASVQVVGVSCDPMFTQRAWAQEQGFDFPLLSDFWPHGAIARSFGVFDDASGHAIRGTFLVDAQMAVRWSLVVGAGEQRDFAPAIAAVEALGE